jgi:aryl-alcohol dehydrogenase-like predicted oxidoreductase
MKKTQFGSTGIEISRVIYGGVISMEDGQENSDSYVRYAIENGVNYFDIAPSYGDAQEKLGNSLLPYRKQVHIACKTTERSAAGAKKELLGSLRALHTDYLDVYQLHALSSEADVEKAFGPGGAMETFVRAKEEGKVGHLGITCHSEKAALDALTRYPFESIVFPFNWGLHMGKGFGGEVLRAAHEKHLGLIGMKSMIKRAWIDKSERQASAYPKSWCKPFATDDPLALTAIKYALSLKVPVLVPPGNFAHFKFYVEHIDECIANPLTPADTAQLQAILPEAKSHYFF